MLSKTRTTIITLVAAFSFAGVAVAPTVSQAQIFRPRDHKAVCAALWHDYNQAYEHAKQYNAEGDKEATENALARMTEAAVSLAANGCLAGRAQPESSLTGGVVAPVG